MLPTHKWSVMGVRRSVVRAPVDVGVGLADHVQRLVLDLVHEPRGRGGAGVGDAVAVALLVRARVVHHGVVLGGEVVDLRLVVVVVVSHALDDVRRVVRRAGHAARRQRYAAHDGGRVQQRLLELLGVAGRVRRVRRVRGVRRRVRRVRRRLRRGGRADDVLH